MKRWISALLCAAVCSAANAAEPEKKDVSLYREIWSILGTEVEKSHAVQH